VGSIAERGVKPVAMELDDSDIEVVDRVVRKPAVSSSFDMCGESKLLTEFYVA
jgi:hypothetical protein